MHGNIWEWTHDWYGEYDPDDTINPQGPAAGTKKVNRGGGDPPGNRGSGIGFRLVKSE